MIEIPELIETQLVAKTIHWTTAKTTRFFIKLGIAGRFDGWRDAMIVRSHFEATMPHIYRLFVEQYTAGNLVSKRGRPSIRSNLGNLGHKKAPKR